MIVAIVDYGAGNLRSAEKAFVAAADDHGARVLVTARPEDIRSADKIVLPGVGAFADCKRGLDSLPGMVEALEEQVLKVGKPFLGICVGLQLLVEGSEEAPGVAGLGVLPGRVVRFPDGAVSVPHMGWNTLHPFGDSPLLAGVADGAHAYFAHSYVVEFDEAAASFPAGATTTYGATRFLSAVSRGALHATQFHPEKSQRVGLQILANFAQAARGTWAARG
jgi:glutamine amidotransferase